MELEFTTGLLDVWYDTWLALIGSAIAIVLAVLVSARRGWSAGDLMLKTVLVIAVLATLPLTLARLGMNMALSEPADPVAYLSLVASIGAIVVGVPALMRWPLRGRVGAMGGERTGTLVGEEDTPPEGVPVGEETVAEGPATATLGATPEPEARGATLAGEGQAPTAWLLFRSGPNAGQSIPLKAGETVIGRAAENDVVVEDAAVSRRHARITYREGQYVLEDAGSSGGTIVEGTVTTAQQPLTSGSTIQLGETELVFMQTGAALPGKGAAGQTVSGGTVSPRTSAGAPGETMVMGQQQQPAVMAWLAVRSGPSKGATFQLRAADMVMGRDQGNDIVLEDPGVSRRHAMLRHQEGKFLLLDIGSSGGTRLNGESIEGRTMREGSVLQVGQTRMTLVSVEGQEPQAPADAGGRTIVGEPGGSGGGVLIVQSGPDAGKSYPLREGDNLLGREPSAGVLLSDPAVSRQHALVRRQADRVVVYDLGSRSGTQVDGQGAVARPLTSGDSIAVGRSELVFMQVEA